MEINTSSRAGLSRSPRKTRKTKPGNTIRQQGSGDEPHRRGGRDDQRYAAREERGEEHTFQNRQSHSDFKISQIACHNNIIRARGERHWRPGAFLVLRGLMETSILCGAMDKKLVQEIRKNIAGEVLPGEPLARHTTYRVGGKAEILVCPRDADDAARVYSFVKREGVPCAVIGAGSNVIAPDEGIDGVVIKTMSPRRPGSSFSAAAGLGRTQACRFSISCARPRPAGSPGSNRSRAFRERSAGPS